MANHMTSHGDKMVEHDITSAFLGEIDCQCDSYTWSSGNHWHAENLCSVWTNHMLFGFMILQLYHVYIYIYVHNLKSMNKLLYR